MDRRTFVQTIGIGLGLGISDLKAMNSQEESKFIDRFGYGVVDFFHNNWDVEDLEGELEDVVGFTCYAYGEIEELGSDEEQSISSESGFLGNLRNIALEDLNNNPETYDWILNLIEDIAGLLDHLDVFPDDLGEILDGVSTAGQKVSKYIPIVANVKQILDIGCDIYDKIQMDKSPSDQTYMELFEHVALTIVEVLLLATGVSASYKVAFGATGWANNRLINVVGRRIGWRAYSWVLSQIHWGVRICFAEGVGQVISEVTEEVSQGLVSASKSGNNPLSKPKAREIARRSVKIMADHSDEWAMNYEIWKLNRWKLQKTREASQWTKPITDGIDSFFEGIPI